MTGMGVIVTPRENNETQIKEREYERFEFR